MDMARRVEDCIYHIFHRYDIQGCDQAQERLKELCMIELKQHPTIMNVIKTPKQMEFFVLQVALKNVGATCKEV